MVKKSRHIPPEKMDEHIEIPKSNHRVHTDRSGNNVVQSERNSETVRILRLLDQKEATEKQKGCE